MTPNPASPRLNAEKLSRLAQIKVPAKDLLKEARSASHYAELLVANHHWMAAINYMAHAITPREAIWWAWYCARKSLADKMTPEFADALKVAELWIAQPTEEHRLKAHDLAQRIESGTSPQLVLEAIFATGELEDPITGNKVAPIAYMPAKYVNATVIGSCYAPDPENPEATANDFLRQAFEVAARINLWSNYE